MGIPPKHKYSRMLLLALAIGTGALVQGQAQESGFRVIDQVDLPEALGDGKDMDIPEALGGGKNMDIPEAQGEGEGVNLHEAQGEGEGSTRYLEFRENWVFVPDGPSLLKNTLEYHLRDTRDTIVPSDDLQVEFGDRVRRLPVKKGRVQIDGIRYEFVLLDPHLMGSGLEGFQVPDSMDRNTRELQEAFITLLKKRTMNGDRYDWEQEMLSVEFLEQWSIDPVTLEINRTVESVTPVIWQRRQTEEGVPVDEAGTGYPVYYKNSLRPVPLRNP